LKELLPEENSTSREHKKRGADLRERRSARERKKRIKEGDKMNRAYRIPSPASSPEKEAPINSRRPARSNNALAVHGRGGESSMSKEVWRRGGKNRGDT